MAGETLFLHHYQKEHVCLTDKTAATAIITDS